MRSSKRKLISLSIGIAISGACLYWLLHSIDFNQLLHTLRNANPYLIGVAFILTLSSYFIRAWRWRFFFRNTALSPSYYNLVRCLFVGFFMNNVLPARAGELVRAHVGSRQSAEGRTEVLATVAAERLVDGVTISALFSLLFTFFSSSTEIETGKELFYVSWFFAGAAISTALLLVFRNQLYLLLEKGNNFLPWRISGYTLSRIKRFIQGLEPLLSASKLACVIPQSLLIWSVELGVYYFISLAYHQNLSLGALILFLTAVNFSSLIPAAPGGLGVIEAFTTLALVQVGIEREVALAMVVTQHIVQILVVGIPGSLFLSGTLGSLRHELKDETDKKPSASDQVDVI